MRPDQNFSDQSLRALRFVVAFKKLIFRKVALAVLVLMTAAAFLPLVVEALQRTWANSGSDYNTGANWGGTAPGAGDVGFFNTAESVQPNLSSSLSNAGLYFSGAASSGYDVTSSNSSVKFTLTGTGATGSGGSSNSNAAALRSEITSGTNTIDAPIILGAAAASTQVFFQSAGGTLIVNGPVSSTNAVTLSLKGTGTIQLNGSNSFTTASNIADPGTLVIGNDSALSTGSFTMSTSGTLQAGGGARSLSNNIVWNGDGTISGSNIVTFNGSFTGSGSTTRTLTVSNTGGSTLAGNVFLSEVDSSRTFTINGTGPVTISGVIANNNVGNTQANALSYTGNSTLTLSNTNTYTGSTTVSGGGSISVSSIGNSGSSGGVGAGTTINLGGSSTSGTLVYTGSGENTNKIINLPAAGGGTIDQSGSGLLKFNTTTAGTGVGTRNLTLQGSTSGTGEMAGAIVNGATTVSVVKVGSGTWNFSGANTYTGGTTITGGTLALGALGVLADAGAIVFGGGTLKTGSFNETVGTLTLINNSAITLNGAPHELKFADSSAASWTSGKALIINGWSGNWNGTSGLAGKVFVGSNSSGLTAGQLSQIQFYDGASHLFPATILSTGEVVPLSSPTAVALISFSATQSGNDVFLQWRSGYEVRNLGYNVYREENGVRTLITPSLIAGSALVAGRQTEMTAGQSYGWVDENRGQRSEVRGRKSEVTYWLEDVDLDGTRTMHGPIAVDVGNAGRVKDGAEDQKNQQRSLLLDEVGSEGASVNSQGVIIDGWATGIRGPRIGAEGQKLGVEPAAKAGGGRQISDSRLQISQPAVQSLADQQAIAATPGVKLSVSKAGWYRVMQPELVAAGLDGNANAAQLQLFANAVEVPIRVSGNGVKFTSADYLEFYGQGVDSATDNQQTYYLIVGTTNGKRVNTIADGSLPPPSGPSNFSYTVERKERSIYFSGLLNGDAENFFGRIIKPAAISATIPVTHLDQSSVADAQLQVIVQGVNTGAHSVHVVVNGTDVGTMNFVDMIHAIQTFNVPAATLIEGNNTVLLNSGGPSDVSLIDTLRITYAHSYAADNNALPITVTDGGVTRVDGFANGNLQAVDITDPLNVQELTPTITAQAGGTYSADVRVSGASPAQPRSIYLFADTAVMNVDALKHNYASTWNASTNAANYLVITTKDFTNNVQPLVNLRQSKGLGVEVIDVEDLYDEFTYGLHSPTAIHDFLLMAANSWQIRPKYVLLVGDSSYDPKNYFSLGLNDLVPSKLIDTFQLETASDDWLADFDGDGVADLAIGRLPARTAADAAKMANKIVSYENTPADPNRGALLVADASFDAASTSVSNVLPAGLPKQSIVRGVSDDATTHSQILSALNQGPRVANYFGHGSNGVWTSAPLLSSLDAPTLTNRSQLSMFTMMTCFNGYFVDAINDSLSEALLKSNGGAVAVWASTGLTEPGGQNVIGQQFYSSVFGSQPRLGDAVRVAKQASLDVDVRRTWTLFGDPAMSLVPITPTAMSASISGHVSDAAGDGMGGVTIEMAGAQSRSTITDANGNYSFSEVEANGFYSVTPLFANYSFSPATKSFSLLGSHTEASFTGTSSGSVIVNPLDTDQFFVRQHYLDFLNREPDESGLKFWTTQITSCGADAACRESRRVNTSGAYFLSIEYQETGFEVYRLYQAAFGNMSGAPVPVRLDEFLAGARTVGQGVIVNQTGWQRTLETNKQAFSLAFVSQPRFVTAYPLTLTPDEFADQLFSAAKLNPSADERTAVVIEFAGAAKTTDLNARAHALRRVAQDPNFVRREFSRAFVLMQYFGYLRRDPNSGPDRDYSGYDFWLDKLNRFGGNFIEAEMVKAFISSDEYRRRFSP